MSFGGSSVSGPRPYNEDNYLMSDLCEYRRQLGGLIAFVMVSDGMGGHSSGDVASRVAVETAESYVRDLLKLATESDLDVDAARALTEISEEAHDAIVAEAGVRGAASIGATFIAAFVSRNHAWIGHVGDSRAYLLSGGKARQLTTDHSQVGRLISEGVLTEEQAQHHPQRNVIERALGFTGASADVTEVDLKPGDAILLCSDGVSTALTGAELVSLAVGASGPQSAAAALTDGAISAGGDDNATAVIWANDWSAFRSASGSAVAAAGGRHRATRRRLPSRHHRAQRASFVALGVLAAAAVVAIGFGALSSPPRTSGAAPSVVGSATTSGSAVGTSPSDPVVPPTALIDLTVTQPGGENLRSKISTGTTEIVATVDKGATLHSDEPRKDARGHLWYHVPRAQILPDAVNPIPGLHLKIGSAWPKDGVWIWADSVKKTSK